jgi:hypothetical protein
MARPAHIVTGRASLLCPAPSDINLFRYGKGIIDLDAEVPDGAFDFGVAKQELHGPQIARSTIDQRCLCSPQRMGAKELWFGNSTFVGRDSTS